MISSYFVCFWCIIYVRNNLPYDTIPKIMLTNAEQREISRLVEVTNPIVKKYVQQWVINGDVDATWDAYVNEIKGAGIDRIVEIYQTALDRINAAS